MTSMPTNNLDPRLRKYWRDIEAIVPTPDIALDCGAHVGETSVELRNMFPNATIYAFEPASIAFETLRINCQALRVHPVNVAVGNHVGRAILNHTATPQANSLFGFEAGNPCAADTAIIGSEEVDVITLDGWCADNGIDTTRIDVLKIDIQGSELAALKGATRILETVPAVFIEVCYVPLYKGMPLYEEIDVWLFDVGYRLHDIYKTPKPDAWGDALYVRRGT